uniref:VQ domain-containing protein n=1 Tax=Davidia involucrata TaxID=16924 RepID=A0A5B7CB42_DAVIN
MSMRPAKFDDEEVRRVIHGPRPSPLRINKDSHAIQKPAANHQQQQRRNPVIIYTHSPKIIHTQARDFMALVQKLTGQNSGENNLRPIIHEDNESSSVLTDENCCGDFKESSSSVSPIFNINPNPYFADMPLFTPNSNDFFCSPRHLFRYPSPNMGNLIMKGLPEY